MCYFDETLPESVAYALHCEDNLPATWDDASRTPMSKCHIQEGTTMAQHGLYQPKIADEHIRQLYQWAKRFQMPMTRLVNALLAHALARLEQGVENVTDPIAGADGRRTRRPKENQ